MSLFPTQPCSGHDLSSVSKTIILGTLAPWAEKKAIAGGAELHRAYGRAELHVEEASDLLGVISTPEDSSLKTFMK